MANLARGGYVIFGLALLLCGVTFARAQDGFCMVEGTTTGGTGGTVVTVTNGTDFNTQINIAGPRIIQVQGPINIGRVSCTANKTIIGIDTNAMLYGNLNISGISNVIVRNLRVSCPYNDGITIRENGALPGSHHVWIDHCTFIDCNDGSCDISVGATYVTVSWCKFIYPTQLEHRFTMIADGQDGNTNSGHITLHHNWWSTGADQRMAASSYARIHYYNNYFNCTNNSYSSNARNGTEMNSVSNYYSGVKDPLTVSSGTDGKIQSTGNIYSGCTGTIHPGTDTVFTPPYAFTPDAAANVPTIVVAGAGAPGADVVIVPAKIWDGGGANNNLNTANNWGLNENPKQADTLVFTGSTRLTPNNDITANTQFPSLVFNSNAGPFVLGGNALNLGKGITNDSTAVQTINLKLDFTYGADHYAMNREFNVSSPSGSLVINGDVVGNTNIYFKPYGITKSGAGMLTLSGANSFPGSLNFVGGLVQFSAQTNLGATNLVFNGGGLQWANGNAVDISTLPVAVSSGGATFDVGVNDVTFANPVGVGGAGGVTKTGAGRLTLNGNNTFSGVTLINQGTLALGTAGALPNSTRLIVSNDSVLDVSGRSDGTLTLSNGKRLQGNGSVLGSVTAANGSTITPGFSVGTLIVTNVLTFQAGSTNVMELDKSAPGTNDLITGIASVNYGGRLVVTNLGTALQAGDTFKLFNAQSYSSSFSSIAWPPLTGNLIWTNRLAVDGTIAVIAPVNTAPTNLISVAAGGQLQLSWPGDRVGWHLEVQTNGSGTGLSANWFIVPGSTGTNQMLLPISAEGGSVFYRLAYP